MQRWQVILCFSLLLGDSAVSEAQEDAATPLARLLQELDAHKTEILQSEGASSAKLCTNRTVPVQMLEPSVLRSGSFEAMAVSANGAMALSDVESRNLLVYPSALGDQVIAQPQHLGMREDSLRLSPDGRYAAWLGVRTRLYDTGAHEIVPLPEFESALAIWWVGDSLLAELDDHAIALFVPDDGTFHETLLSPAVKQSRETPAVGDPWRAQHERFAYPDQTGQVFATETKVYQSIAAAQSDGAIVVPPLLDKDRVWSTGDGVITLVTRDDTPGESGTIRPTSVFVIHETFELILRDRVTGARRAARVLKDGLCTPRDIAVSPDGRLLAVFAGSGALQLLDTRDLSTRAIYELDVDRMENSNRHIAFALDGSLLARSDFSVRRYQLPVLRKERTPDSPPAQKQ